MRRAKSQKTSQSSKEPATLPERPAVNKSEAIRKLIEEWTQAGRDCQPKNLTEELKRRYPSHVWSLPYVYSIKSRLKKQRPPQAPDQSHADPASTLPAQDPAALVLAVKNLAKQAGGLDRLKRLIEALQSDS
jgi:hypothetical protein